ncbi:MAG: hypothetical protein LBQ35_07075 [Spirochaetaceae bacterium]|jgi:hypothetical protein|nr:hypothetical protein [Spirochaetaceae bacterium]
MAERLTLFDVFNAASRFGGQVAETVSREQRYVLDRQIALQAGELEKMQYRVIAQYPEFQNNPARYRDFMDQELDNWYRGAMGAGNNSRYYVDRVNAIRAEGHVTFGKKFAEAELARERDQARAAHNRVLDEALNDPDPERALETVRAENQAYFDLGAMNETQRQEADAAAAAAVFQRMTDVGNVGDMNARQWRDYLSAAAAREEFAGVANRERLVQRAAEAGIEAVQNRNSNWWQGIQNRFESLTRQYAETGDPRLLQQALDLHDRYAGARDSVASGDGEDFSILQRARIGGFLDTSRTAGGSGGASGGQEAFLKSLQSSVYQGLDAARPGVDAAGNALDPGVSLAAAYTALSRYAQENGIDAQVLRAQFDSNLIAGTGDRLGNLFGMETGAAALREIISMSESELAALKDQGLDGGQAGRDLAASVLNAMAAWEYAGNHSKEAEEALVRRLREIKNGYVAALLEKNSLLRDSPADSASQYRVSGDVAQAARGYAAALANPAVATRSRDGNGYFTSPTMNDSVASYISVAQELMARDLGFAPGSVSVENGKEVTGVSPSGKRYRIRGTEEGEWILQEERARAGDAGAGGEEAAAWVTVAKRISPTAGWGRTNERGEISTAGARELYRAGRLTPAQYAEARAILHAEEFSIE